MKDSFNLASFGKFVFQAVVIGLVVGGIFDFTLFHEHPIGAKLLSLVREPLLSFYDTIAYGIGMPELARNQDFLVQNSVTGDDVGLCTEIDPTTFLPVPCV